MHVVTVNDYLAERDSKWMGEIYKFLGMKVGCVLPNLSEGERKEAYTADITYGTNNEFGFDYLRDNLPYSLSDMVQRPYSFAIIDEVDSILIDEARTPLVISGSSEDNTEVYVKIQSIITKLDEADCQIDLKMRTVMLSDKGNESVEELLKKHNLINGTSGLYDMENILILHHVNQALKANKLFKYDVDYIIQNNKVMIIDEFTG